MGLQDFGLYAVYVNHYDDVLDSIQDLQKRNPKFAEILRSGKGPVIGSLGIEDYLSKPFQRLCQYPLLFQKLKKNTPPNHPDYDGTLSLPPLPSILSSSQNIHMRLRRVGLGEKLARDRRTLLRPRAEVRRQRREGREAMKNKSA